MSTKNLQLLFHSVRVGAVRGRLNSPWIQKGQNSQYSPQSRLVTIYIVLFCCSVFRRKQTGNILELYYSCSWLDTSWVLPFLLKLHLKVLRERDTCQSEENLFPVLVGEEDHLYINGDNKNVTRRRMNMIEQIHNGSSWISIREKLSDLTICELLFWIIFNFAKILYRATICRPLDDLDRQFAKMYKPW